MRVLEVKKKMITAEMVVQNKFDISDGGESQLWRRPEGAPQKPGTKWNELDGKQRLVGGNGMVLVDLGKGVNPVEDPNLVIWDHSDDGVPNLKAYGYKDGSGKDRVGAVMVEGENLDFWDLPLGVTGVEKLVIAGERRLVVGLEKDGGKVLLEKERGGEMKSMKMGEGDIFQYLQRQDIFWIKDGENHQLIGLKTGLEETVRLGYPENVEAIYADKSESQLDMVAWNSDLAIDNNWKMSEDARVVFLVRDSSGLRVVFGGLHQNNGYLDSAKRGEWELGMYDRLWYEQEEGFRLSNEVEGVGRIYALDSYGRSVTAAVKLKNGETALMVTRERQYWRNPDETREVMIDKRVLYLQLPERMRKMDVDKVLMGAEMDKAGIVLADGSYLSLVVDGMSGTVDRQFMYPKSVWEEKGGDLVVYDPDAIVAYRFDVGVQVEDNWREKMREILKLEGYRVLFNPSGAMVTFEVGDKKLTLVGIGNLIGYTDYYKPTKK